MNAPSTQTARQQQAAPIVIPRITPVANSAPAPAQKPVEVLAQAPKQTEEGAKGSKATADDSPPAETQPVAQQTVQETTTLADKPAEPAEKQTIIVPAAAAEVPEAELTATTTETTEATPRSTTSPEPVIIADTATENTEQQSDSAASLEPVADTNAEQTQPEQPVAEQTAPSPAEPAADNTKPQEPPATEAAPPAALAPVAANEAEPAEQLPAIESLPEPAATEPSPAIELASTEQVEDLMEPANTTNTDPATPTEATALEGQTDKETSKGWIYAGQYKEGAWVLSGLELDENTLPTAGNAYSLTWGANVRAAPPGQRNSDQEETNLAKNIGYLPEGKQIQVLTVKHSGRQGHIWLEIEY